MKTLLEMGKFDKELSSENKMVIFSGEGEDGTFEEYDGERTVGAIKKRIKKESAAGDRWASAWIFSHVNDGGNVYINLENGDYRHINDEDIG